MHDALTLMAVIYPDMFIYESYPVTVVDKLEGPARGKVLPRQDLMKIIMAKKASYCF